jgi:hypothetical protein
VTGQAGFPRVTGRPRPDTVKARRCGVSSVFSWATSPVSPRSSWASRCVPARGVGARSDARRRKRHGNNHVSRVWGSLTRDDANKCVSVLLHLSSLRRSATTQAGRLLRVLLLLGSGVPTEPGDLVQRGWTGRAARSERHALTPALLDAGRPSFGRVALRTRSEQDQKEVRVEGAVTSGSGFGAVCRPLTDEPLMEARPRGAVGPPFVSSRRSPRSLGHRPAGTRRSPRRAGSPDLRLAPHACGATSRGGCRRAVYRSSVDEPEGVEAAANRRR